VLLFRDAGDPTQVDGVTWDGDSAGRVGSVSSQSGILQNPAGTRYAVSSGAVYDRTGARVGSGPATKDSWLWADDGGSYCRIDHASALPPVNGEPATLTVGGLGPATHTVAQVGTEYEQAGVTVAACSVESDRAVVVQTTGQGLSASQVRVVQLSTGRVLWTRALLAGDTSAVHVSASRDGQYVAVVTSRSSTTVYGPDGMVAGQVSGAVEAFSWDGTLAVVSAPTVSVVQWRSGATIWSAPAGLTFVGSLPEPGGQRIAIAVHDRAVPQTGGFTSYDLYAVGPDGQARALVQGVTS
jgi:hypothetical protein